MGSGAAVWAIRGGGAAGSGCVAPPIEAGATLASDALALTKAERVASIEKNPTAAATAVAATTPVTMREVRGRSRLLPNVYSGASSS